MQSLSYDVWMLIVPANLLQSIVESDIRGLIIYRSDSKFYAIFVNKVIWLVPMY
jgi:hypothetical protein